ncbi:hypothetical protein [Nocardiopsis sp. CNT312]|uniref:hypothetical protein n=1 Tax=Nocardiopsis sp. CNT312 TaxID=1137268 RepID=UPI000490EB60|nr:hypothetical protein [Nocardiopsis sp. CNT312]
MSPAPLLSAYLPLRYVLTDSLAVRTSYDPSGIDSEHVIGGRAQRGMLAAALTRAGRHDDLHAWVARGDRIRFAPAHPRLERGPGRTAPAVAYPPPAYLHTPGKEGDTTVDVFGHTDPATPYRAVRDPLTPDRALRARVHTTAERRLGRTRTGARTQGVPFVTTALDAGQVFEARWQLRAPDTASLERLAERVAAALARAEGTLTLGSGGTRAHGGVSVAPVDPDRLLSPDRIDPAGRVRTWPAGSPVDLILLSPALVVDEHGRHRPSALTRAVLDLCARVLPDTRVEVLADHVEAESVGGYHRGYRGPMAERWAARPGAVVRLRPDRDLTTARARLLEAHTLGERAVDGYGQFTLASPPPAGPEPLAPQAAPFAARRRPAPPEPDRDERLRLLYDRLLWEAAVRPVRDHARALARASAPRSAELPPHLLECLREVLAQPRRTPGRALSALEHTVAPNSARGPGNGAGELCEHDLRALDRALLVRPDRPGRTSVRSWLEGLSTRTTAWWDDNRPGRAPAYTGALAVVDLTLADGRPPATAAGLSRHALEWERRAAPCLSLLLVSSWLAETARAARGGPE